MKYWRFIGLTVLALGLLFGGARGGRAAYGDYRNVKSAIVKILCTIKSGNDYYQSNGSAVLVSPNGKLLTNAHVVKILPNDEAYCQGSIISDPNSYDPAISFNIDFFYFDYEADVAFGQVDSSKDGLDYYLPQSVYIPVYPYLNLEFQNYRGEKIWLLGFPSLSNGSLNITEGTVLYKDTDDGQNVLFTDAVVFAGNSGGAGINDQDKLLGLVTSLEEKNQVAHILDIDFLYRQREKLLQISGVDVARARSFIDEILTLNNAFSEAVDQYPDTQGRCMENAYRVGENSCQCNDGYILYNYQCITYEQACRNWYGDYSTFSESTQIDSKEVKLTCSCQAGSHFNESYTACVLDATTAPPAWLLANVKGRLLLQVENRGRIWYVYPVNNLRYEVTKENILPLFRSLSLGISNSDLARIPLACSSLSAGQDSDKDGFNDQTECQNGYNIFGSGKKINDKTLAARVKGRLLLQVEDRGRIWYVHPVSLTAYEVRLDNFMDLFRSLSLGISNANLGLLGQGIFDK
ncbi:MAG TPA: serine protease [bacterium]|nr:serine protease [bacterium]